ncbi:hypothetical protein ANN_03582 [Periplaneta americana]|uniref:Uncharacterized protein n=1 Tax=Periplaneta americana TaxID=6978 RepID=A0ABQ8TZ93_PERAM|nr:hypothetical protein ANN_03582 [Periplaneta americana]
MFTESGAPRIKMAFNSCIFEHRSSLPSKETLRGHSDSSFRLWGHLKSLVYSSPVPDLESFRNRIVACSEDIRNTPGVWDRVRRSMRHRCECRFLGEIIAAPKILLCNSSTDDLVGIRESDADRKRNHISETHYTLQCIFHCLKTSNATAADVFCFNTDLVFSDVFSAGNVYIACLIGVSIRKFLNKLRTCPAFRLPILGSHVVRMSVHRFALSRITCPAHFFFSLSASLLRL